MKRAERASESVYPSHYPLSCGSQDDADFPHDEKQKESSRRKCHRVERQRKEGGLEPSAALADNRSTLALARSSRPGAVLHISSELHVIVVEELFDNPILTVPSPPD